MNSSLQDPASTQSGTGDYDVLGDPNTASTARKLFEESPKQFEIWAIGLVAGVPQPEKSGDKGVDGKVYFMDLEG